MRAWARAAIISATTIWLLALIFVVGLIVGFYSPDLGRGGFSVQAFLGFATGISFLSLLGFAIGFHLGAGRGRMPGKVLCVVVGASAVALSSVALSNMQYQPHNIELVTGITFCIASLTLAFIASKLMNLRKGLLPSKSLERTREE
jgi:hypothetical protein